MTEPAKPAADPSKPAIYYVDADGKLRRDLSVAEIAEVVRGGPGELWVDMRVTSRQCIAMLDNVFAFHPLAVEDALNPASRVKVDEYPGFLFAIVRGVRFVAETEDPYDMRDVQHLVLPRPQLSGDGPRGRVARRSTSSASASSATRNCCSAAQSG